MYKTFFGGISSVVLMLTLVNIQVFAASTNIKMRVTSGSLALEAPTEATIPAIELDGDKVVSGALGKVKVADNRGSGSGWSVTATISSLVCCDNEYTIDASAITLIPGNITVLNGEKQGVISGNTQAVQTSDGIVTLMSASTGNGMGEYEINPQVSIQIPATARAGEYSAAISITVI